MTTVWCGRFSAYLSLDMACWWFRASFPLYRNLVFLLVFFSHVIAYEYALCIHARVCIIYTIPVHVRYRGPSRVVLYLWKQAVLCTEYPGISLDSRFEFPFSIIPFEKGLGCSQFDCVHRERHRTYVRTII